MNTVDLHVHAFASAPPHDAERRVHTPALSIRTLLVLAVALLVPALASVWLMAAPETMTASTYSLSTTAVVALSALAVYRGQADAGYRRVHSGTAGFDAGPYAGSMHRVSTAEHVREHPGGAPMTNWVATHPDPNADVRWRNWQARGAESDRRMATRTRRVMFVVAAAWAIWFSVQLG